MLLKDLKNCARVVAVTASALLFTACHPAAELSQNRLASTSAPRFLEDVSLSGKTSQLTITNPAQRNARSKEYQPHQANTLQLKYAGMMEVLPQAITNFALYSFIDEWYGTPYHLGGNDKTGIDCSAFVQRLYNQVFNLNLVRTAREQFDKCRMIFSTDSLKEGDLVFFKIRSRRISHVGIYLKNNYFVHASSSQGVTISKLSDRYWQKYFAVAGQVPRELY